jgi:hypothetical protein
VTISSVGNEATISYRGCVKNFWMWAVYALVVTPAPAAVVITGSSSTPAGLDTVVNNFRTLISGSGTNNGVGGGVFPDGRREVSWDVASLDPHQVPAFMPATFFNNQSLRGLTLSTPGELVVSGRAASGSTDVRFSTLNPDVASQLQTFSPDRLLSLYGATTVDAAFSLPSAPGVQASVRGFGAVFADVSLFGSTRLEAFGRSGQLLATVDVPASPGGLSFAGIWMNEGEPIDRIRLTLGQAGIEGGATNLDRVALDDFLYSEPSVVPEPAVALLTVAGGLSLFLGRRRLDT